MADAGDPLYGGGNPHTGPEQWLRSGPDPMQSFGNTVEQALSRLSIELAGLRAERDGMRLELEGLRTQLQIAQQQLADRDRFVDTVRELSQIVTSLTMPTGWQAPPMPPQAYAPPTYAPPAPPPYVPPTYAPPAPPPQAYAPPPAPEPQAYAPPPPPPAPEPQAYAPPPPPPAPEPYVPPAPAPEPVPEPQAYVPPAPEPEPVAPAFEAFAPPAAEPAPAPEPVLPPPPAPEPEPEPIVLGAATPVEEPVVEPSPGPSPYASEPVTDSYRRVDTSLETRRENFFDQPGTWYEEPPKLESRLSTFKAWGSRIGTVVGGIVVLIVLLVSVGPKFLPYQTYFVRSGSMSPTFDTGDLIVLSKANAASLQKGDIITFDRPDKPGTLVTHRIFEVKTSETGKTFVTKGDANGDVDPWEVPASGDGWKYKARLPKLGFVFGYLGTPQARLMLLAVPAVLLGILSLVDIWKPQAKTARRGR